MTGNGNDPQGVERQQDQLGKKDLFFGQTKRVPWWHLPLDRAIAYDLTQWADNSAILTIVTPDESVSSLVSHERAVDTMDYLDERGIFSVAVQRRTKQREQRSKDNGIS